MWYNGELVIHNDMRVPHFGRNFKSFYKWWKKATRLDTNNLDWEYNKGQLGLQLDYTIEISKDGYDEDHIETEDDANTQLLLDGEDFNCVYQPIIKEFQDKADRERKKIEQQVLALQKTHDIMKKRGKEGLTEIDNKINSKTTELRKAEKAIQDAKEYEEIFKDGTPLDKIDEICEELNITINIFAWFPVNHDRISYNAKIKRLREQLEELDNPWNDIEDREGQKQNIKAEIKRLEPTFQDKNKGRFMLTHGAPKNRTRKVFNFLNTRLNHIEPIGKDFFNWLPFFGKAKLQEHIYDYRTFKDIGNFVGDKQIDVLKGNGKLFKKVMEIYPFHFIEMTDKGQVSKVYADGKVWVGRMSSPYAEFCKAIKVHSYDRLKHRELHDAILSACICPTQSFLDRGAHKVKSLLRKYGRREEEVPCEQFWLPNEARHIDMVKAYANGHLSDYFNGYMGRIWNWGRTTRCGICENCVWSGEKDKRYICKKVFPAQNGVAFIYGLRFRTDEANPQLIEWFKTLNIELPTKVATGFPDCCLKFFDDFNIQYTADWFIAGQRIETERKSLFPKAMIDDKSYTFWSGIQIKNEPLPYKRISFSGDENTLKMLQTCVEDGITFHSFPSKPDEIEAHIPIKSQRVCAQIVSYIYAYCWMDILKQLLRFKDSEDVLRVNADAIYFKANADVEFPERFTEEFRECYTNCFDAWEKWNDRCEGCRNCETCVKYSPCKLCVENDRIRNAFKEKLNEWRKTKPKDDDLAEWEEFYKNTPVKPTIQNCKKVRDTRFRTNAQAPELYDFDPPSDMTERYIASLPAIQRYSKYELHSGQGGCGKTYKQIVELSKYHIDPIFMTLTHALISGQRLSAKEHKIDLNTSTFASAMFRKWKRCMKCENCKRTRECEDKKCKGGCKKCRLFACSAPVAEITEKIQKNINRILYSGVVLFDEAPIIPTTEWKAFQKEYPNQRILYMGDPLHQLSPIQSPEDEIDPKTFWGDTHTYEGQYRAKDERLRTINDKLREMLNKIWNGERTHENYINLFLDLLKDREVKFGDLPKLFNDRCLVINSTNDFKDRTNELLSNAKVWCVKKIGSKFPPDPYHNGDIIHGEPPDCFKGKEEHLVRQVAYTAHSLQGRTFEGDHIFLDLNGMERSAGFRNNFIRMLNMSVGRCEYIDQLYWFRSPYEKTILGTGHIYKLTSRKSNRYYIGRTFHYEERMREHEKDFQEGNNATMSAIVFKDGEVEKEILFQRNFYYRCKCEACRKNDLCEKWIEYLGKTEGRYIRYSKSRNDGCINDETPFAEVISSDLNESDTEEEVAYESEYFG